MQSVTNHSGDAIEAFRCAMASHGLDYGGPIIADGKLHRIKVEGDKERNSYYVIHPDSPIAGAFGCWKRGIKETWCHQGGGLSQADWNAVRERWKASERERERSEAETQAEARRACQWVLSVSSPVDSHSYLDRKGIMPCGAVRLYRGTFAIPLRDVYGTLQSLQFIGADGVKRFKEGGRTAGAFFAMGDDESGPLVICEGYATGASIHQATDYQTACALYAGNLLPVAKALRAKYPARAIIIAADDDAAKAGNPGLTKGTEAAKAINARLAVPTFPEGKTGTDFNDLHAAAGALEVKRQIDAATVREIISQAEKPAEAKPFFDLEARTGADPDELLKDRYLCRGGACLLVAPTGVGKSVLLSQMVISFALGKDCFGIQPARPLTSLIVQAENDDGDLAEMRDGVVYGLRLTPQEIHAAKGRVFVYTEDTKTGAALTALVDTLLEKHKPDLFCLDPALSYLGGEANSQKDVGGFLRNMLNPVLHRHGCGCILVHHTNKPASGNEKGEWKAGDFAYLGAGSAEWANWARAVLAVRSIGSNSIYEKRAGKRGARLGWKDQDGGTTYARLIGHSLEPGRIYWRDASEDELNQGGRPKNYSASDLLELLPPEGLTTTDWKDAASEECGIKERRFYQLIKELNGDRIFKSKINQKWQPILKKAA